MPAKNQELKKLPPVSADVLVRNPRGLHLRFAGLIARQAFQYQSQITIVRGTKKVDARSMLELGTLSATCGTRLKVRANGSDAAEAVGAMVRLFRNYQDSEA